MASYQLLGPTNLVQDLDFVGDPIRAAGWFGMPEGLHTVAIYTNDFTGRIFIEGSLSTDPNTSDWFPIKLSTCDYIEFPRIPNAPQSMNTGDTSVVGYTFRSNILWIRAKVWRSYFTSKITSSNKDTMGSISQIMIAY